MLRREAPGEDGAPAPWRIRNRPTRDSGAGVGHGRGEAGVYAAQAPRASGGLFSDTTTHGDNDHEKAEPQFVGRDGAPRLGPGSRSRMLARDPKQQHDDERPVLLG